MAKRKAGANPNPALKASLEGLRDALDLTLTRVIEDDMGVDEAHDVLRYLEKELTTFEGRDSKGGHTPRKIRPRNPRASRGRPREKGR